MLAVRNSQAPTAQLHLRQNPVTVPSRCCRRCDSKIPAATADERWPHRFQHQPRLHHHQGGRPSHRRHHPQLHNRQTEQERLLKVDAELLRGGEVVIELNLSLPSPVRPRHDGQYPHHHRRLHCCQLQPLHLHLSQSYICPRLS
jgi:hypothetical protein